MAARIPSPKYSKLSGYRDAKHLPKPFKLRRFYTPSEVAHHQTSNDCWVSFFNDVYDLSKLI
jgi:cytochrome b involved in lipid metabolism